MKLAPALLLFIILSLPCYSQKFLTLPYYNADSLLQVLPGQQGNERVNTLNRLGVSLFFKDTEASTAFTEEAMNLARELDYDRGIADAFRNQGYIEQYKGNYSKALGHFLDALSLYEKLDLKHIIGWIYYDLARTHYLANNHKQAIEYGHLSLKVFREKIHGDSTVGNAFDTICLHAGFALVYRLTGDSDKALKTYLTVLDLMQLNRQYFDNLDLAIISWNVGNDYFLLDKLDSAKIYMHRTLAYPNENLDIQGMKARAEWTLEQMFRYEEKYDSALYYAQKAHEWYLNHGLLYWAFNTSMDMGWIYFRQNELDKAEQNLKQSERIFLEMQRLGSWCSHDSLKSILTIGLERFFPMSLMQWKFFIWQDGSYLYYRLFKLYEAKNNPGTALKYHIAYSDALDTLNILNQEMATMELQTRYETEQKEKQITFLARENEFKAYKLNQSRVFIFGLTGLLLVIAILAVILIRMNKIREQQKNLLLQQKLLRSQMNPHFIFNSLVSIQNFILNQEPAKAGKYLSRFSKLVRSILDSSFKEFVPLEDEIDTIENYLELQKVRYSDMFEFAIDTDPAIDTENTMIPPMLAQPVIENAIEHGFKHKETIGHLYIRFHLKENSLIFEVEDDGIGRKKAMEIMLQQDQEHKSLATAINLERIAVLNRKMKRKIRMEITDLFNEGGDPAGTRVVFGIPIAAQ